MIKVQLDMGSVEIKVIVEDDGKGFDVENVGAQGGMGLKVIRDRVEMLGGNMDVDSVLGQGTRVSFQIPATAIIE
jgi:two-component system sensor histidine kinase DegS